MLPIVGERIVGAQSQVQIRNDAATIFGNVVQLRCDISGLGVGDVVREDARIFDIVVARVGDDAAGVDDIAINAHVPASAKIPRGSHCDRHDQVVDFHVLVAGG